MKLHYSNILLLYALNINILITSSSNVNIQRYSYKTSHTPNTKTRKSHRSLCECELYAPSNYDNDPEMKAVMQGFDRQTSQRFEEYNERLLENKQKCKEQCDKEIQKIILKDKLEKELMDKFATLHTDIQSDAIPTCVCEKSIEDKVEKTCLRCGSILGAAMPEVGSIGGMALYTLSQWKTGSLLAATKYAMKEGAIKGAIAGKARGMEIVIEALKQKGIAEYCPGIYQSILKIERITDLKNFAGDIIQEHNKICALTSTTDNPLCAKFGVRLGTHKAINNPYGPPASDLVPKLLEEVTRKADQTAKEVAKNIGKDVAASITKEKTSEIAATYASWETTIIAAVVAIVVIVLVMIIIYLVLRYRRKKKMKKKLQYIKLLEE
ncbi:hypothetical protein PFNF135_02408 [Plasmodium falciparum NF135/5.C10]|uniref:Surface antigen n=1 Tax=Plasmodium falciparum NF135/5.C10 TaxID=1036726 RepID=W4IK66_PLAFA|nr:hypothetical protein PFNF135_02408 [Plasmodium falciparum NF135/5.C10]